jgi:uncharacterized protein with HEPN domain
MTERFAEDYLRDIYEATEDCIHFVEAMTFEEFILDKKTIYAVARAIQIIGEAVKKVPDSTKALYPEIPWKNVAGMRDKVTHQYFAVKLDIVWGTVQRDLPILRDLIGRILENYQE